MKSNRNMEMEEVTGASDHLEEMNSQLYEQSMQHRTSDGFQHIPSISMDAMTTRRFDP